MKAYAIEEAYEVVDAIEVGDSAELCSELGDLLFQVILMAQIAADEGRFDLNDVVNAISDKMEERHPHVFGDKVEMSPAEVKMAWEKGKAERRGDKGILHGIPKALPALHKARRITDRAAGVGFEWPDVSGVWGKVDEELCELREAADSGDKAAIRDELGDALFTLVNVGRWYDVNPEDALQHTNAKFARRFGYVEAQLGARGIAMGDADLATMDELWNDAKRQETGD